MITKYWPRAALWQRFVPLSQRAVALLYPRRCPLCDGILPDEAQNGAICPECSSDEQNIRRVRLRLQEEQHVLQNLSGAAGVYCYKDAAQLAMLRCKYAERPWYAREFADLMAVHIFGAEPAKHPGERPHDTAQAGFVRYHAIVPVPPHKRIPGKPSVPYLLAKRLGEVLQIEVLDVLEASETMQQQKRLNREERLINAVGAFRVQSGVDLTGKRLLLVDDIITTGATVSQCGYALLQAGAEDVFAASVAVSEKYRKQAEKEGEEQ